jgi:mannose-6-phosphate isomerase-like protein (cupin superfamily)
MVTVQGTLYLNANAGCALRRKCGDVLRDHIIYASEFSRRRFCWEAGCTAYDALPASPRSEIAMARKLPEIVVLASESSSSASYDNHPIATINDHVVRISVMTHPYHWHFHPNSDETFLVVEGRLEIEFEDGALELGPGQMVTVPKGMHHRTRPVGDRSVNLTFEAENAETVAV